MIRSLSIKNYAIIEEIEIRFSNNLTIITGETGAGKSIMLGALGLILGKRADTKVLYERNKKCIVEAVFDVSAYSLKTLFKENDLDYDDETYIRREINKSGKSRAFINDTPVRLDVLKAISGKLIDLHQQFDTLDIHDATYQIDVVDAIAKNKSLRNKYAQKYKQYLQSKKRLEELLEKRQDADKETAFIEFQLEELLSAELQRGEIEELEAEQKRLNNAEDVKRVIGGAAMHINENEQSITNQMIDLSNDINRLVEYHPNLPQLMETFESMLLELQEIGNEFQVIAEETAHDDERLQEVEDRLSTLYNLLNKHNVQTDQELLDIQADLQQQLSGFEDVTHQIEMLEAAIDAQEQSLRTLGDKLSQKRQKVTGKFEKSVKGLLKQLSMKHARLEVEVQPLDDFTPTGTDRLRFLFAANKGTRLEEIKGVASGGELSRLALCIKSLVASAIPLPTLIFDEIDSGVSGEVALQMGLIMQKLSSEHQVVAITHSPQIASKADVHYFVHKKITNNKTKTSLRQLKKKERVLELAKMLSGNPPSEFAKQNALELLGNK